MADVRGGGSDPLAREFELISKWALDHGLEGTHEWDWPCAALSRIEDAAEALRVERDTAVDALRDEIEMAEQSVERLRDLRANWRTIIEEYVEGEPLIENILYWLIEDVTPTLALEALAAVGGTAP